MESLVALLARAHADAVAKLNLLSALHAFTSNAAGPVALSKTRAAATAMGPALLRVVTATRAALEGARDASLASMTLYWACTLLYDLPRCGVRCNGGEFTDFASAAVCALEAAVALRNCDAAAVACGALHRLGVEGDRAEAAAVAAEAMAAQPALRSSAGGNSTAQLAVNARAARFVASRGARGSITRDDSDGGGGADDRTETASESMQRAARLVGEARARLLAGDAPAARDACTAALQLLPAEAEAAGEEGRRDAAPAAEAVRAEARSLRAASRAAAGDHAGALSDAGCALRADPSVPRRT